MFLPVDRKRDAGCEKSRFALVNRLVLETKRKRFEIDDFGILSLARLPIPPPRQIAMSPNVAEWHAQSKLRL